MALNFTSLDLDPGFLDINTTEELEVEQMSLISPSVVAISVIAVLGFIGNTVMLIALLMGYKRGWSNTDLLILNVVVIDLVAVSISAPLSVVAQAFPSFPMGEYGCKAAVYFPLFVCAAVPMGVLSLVLNAAVQRIFRAPCPRWHVFIALIFVWVVAIHVPIPAIVHAKVTILQSYGEEHFLCFITWPWDNKVYDTVIFALFYALPALMLLAFCIVIIAVRRQTTGPAGPHEGRRTDILIIIMAALFVVMYLPYHVAFMYLNSVRGYDASAWIIVTRVGLCLVYLYSAIKPLLCACLYDRFRSAFASDRGRGGLANGTDDRGTELGSM